MMMIETAMISVSTHLPGFDAFLTTSFIGGGSFPRRGSEARFTVSICASSKPHCSSATGFGGSYDRGGVIGGGAGVVSHDGIAAAAGGGAPPRGFRPLCLTESQARAG